MKQKLLEMVQFTLLFCFILMFHTDEFIFVWSFKNGTKTSPRVPKLGYFDGRVPKLSSRVTLATSGAGVVCHISLFVREESNNISLVFVEESINIV